MTAKAKFLFDVDFSATANPAEKPIAPSEHALKLAEAEKTIAATKTAAMANVQGIAIETATAIVERLIGAAPAGKAVESAVADVLKR